MEIFSTFGGMKAEKTSIKVDAKIVKRVKKYVNNTKLTIGDYFEDAATMQLSPRCPVHDNSVAFRGWLKKEGVAFEERDHFTTITGIHELFQLGVKFGIYKALNDPAFKKKDNASNKLHENIIGQDPHNPL